MPGAISEFLAAAPVAVVGASTNRAKYGNIILRFLRARGLPAFAVNRRADAIEGEPAYPSLAACPAPPALAVMVVPPKLTLAALDDAVAAGTPRVWLQDGSYDDAVLDRAAELGLAVVSGACIMVEMNRSS